MSEDGTVYVVIEADYGSTIILGVYVSMDGARDCVERRKRGGYEYSVRRIPLDCDYDHYGNQPEWASWLDDTFTDPD